MTDSGWSRKRLNTAAQRARVASYNSAEHRAERKARLAAHTPASPCTYCGLPLGSNRREWHVPHNPSRTGYEPGLVHGRCNRREAAIRGARTANAQRHARRVRRIQGVTQVRL